MPTSVNPNTLPRLHEQKNRVQRSATAKKLGVIFTADEIRALAPTHPVRAIYTTGGDRAVRAYFASAQPSA